MRPRVEVADLEAAPADFFATMPPPPGVNLCRLGFEPDALPIEGAIAKEKVGVLITLGSESGVKCKFLNKLAK